MEGRHLGLKTFKPNSPTLMRGLESCIRLGSTALVEDLGEEVDPALQTILQNQIVQQVRAHVYMGAVDVAPHYCHQAACSRTDASLNSSPTFCVAGPAVPTCDAQLLLPLHPHPSPRTLC